MVKKTTLPVQSDLMLRFRTVPNEFILDVSTILPKNTNWHIYRKKSGIYLVHFAKPKQERELHKISNYADESIAEDKHMRIESRENYFSIPFNFKGRVLYSSGGVDYSQISNSQTFFQGTHRFRCGDNLEFILSLENRVI